MSDIVTTQVGPWAMVPVWVLGMGLKGAELAVYVSLRSYADRGGDAHPHIKSIAERAGVHLVTAKKAIARFRELDMIRSEQWYRDDGSIGGCRYHLRDVPPGTAVSPPPDEDDATPQEPSGYQGGSPAATRVVAQRLPGGGPAATSRTHQENTPEEHTTITAPPADDLAAHLADAVMDGCGDLGRTITRGPLLRETQRLAALGWTPRTLRKATRDRNWTGCHAGAVIAWLRDLEAPPARDRVLAEARRTGGWVIHGRPDPLLVPCPEHPEHPAGHCPACFAEATDGPPAGWRDRRLTPVPA